jgi:hypothetical protein
MYASRELTIVSNASSRIVSLVFSIALIYCPHQFGGIMTHTHTICTSKE